MSGRVHPLILHFFKTVLAILGPLYFCINLESVCLVPSPKLAVRVGILIGFALNVLIKLGRVDVFVFPFMDINCLLVVCFYPWT